MEERQALVIDREVWLRGDGSSMLLNSDGKRCCVGIYLQSCGLPDGVMFRTPDVGMLVGMHGDKLLPERARWLLDEEGKDVASLIYLYYYNDRPNMDRPERERIITEKFAEYGVDVTFIN